MTTANLSDLLPALLCGLGCDSRGCGFCKTTLPVHVSLRNAPGKGRAKLLELDVNAGLGCQLGDDGCFVSWDAAVLEPLMHRNSAHTEHCCHCGWASSGADGSLYGGIGFGHALPRKDGPNSVCQDRPNRKVYPDRMSFGERLKLIRTRKNLTQQVVADAMGVSKTTISDWEKGKNLPRLERLDLLTETLGVEQRELLFDEGPLVEEPRFLRTDDSAQGPTLQPILAWEHPDDLPEGEFVMVPRLAVKLSAGNGHEQVEIEFTKGMPQAFRAQWIREQRLKPNKLAAMTADGDSMETTIYDGDSLLVDTSQTDVVDGKVFALWYDGGERVKRLFRLPGGGLRIKSDNSEHPTIEVPAATMEHVRILGRVVHRSGRGGL